MNVPRFEFRPTSEKDLPVMQEWFRRPHVNTWWPGPSSLDELREEYLPSSKYGAAHPYLAVLDRRPVGYIQYYVVAEGDPGWWPDQPGAGALGIDQFLGDPQSLGRGLGSAMIAQFTNLLFVDPAVTEIRVDPRPDNIRAIRCYQRVGFREVGPIDTPDGPAVLMILDRPGVRAGRM